MVFTVPTLFELYVIECVDALGAFYVLWGTELRQSIVFNTVYRVVLYSIFMSVGPFLLITVVTTRMIVLVRRAKLFRQSMIV